MDSICAVAGEQLKPAPDQVVIPGPIGDGGATPFIVAEGDRVQAMLTATTIGAQAADQARSIPSVTVGGEDRDHFTLMSAGELAFAAPHRPEAWDAAKGRTPSGCLRDTGTAHGC